MSGQKRMISTGLSDHKFPEGQHICYIYNDDQERLNVMAKYLKSGQQAKEKLLYLVDSMTTGEMLTHLDDLGLDLSNANPADFTLASAAPAYCPSGFFKTEEMLGVVRDFYLKSVGDGYEGARGTGEMDWCLAEGRTNRYDLMEYEARLTGLLKEYPYTAC